MIIITETINGFVIVNTFDDVSKALDYALELIEQNITFKTTYK